MGVGWRWRVKCVWGGGVGVACEVCVGRRGWGWCVKCVWGGGVGGGV